MDEILNLDTGLIASILSEGDSAFTYAKKSGIQETDLEGEDARLAWRFILEHLVEYGKVPSAEYFKAKVAWDDFSSSEPASLYVDQILQRRLWAKLTGLSNELDRHLSERNPTKALEFARDEIRAIDRSSMGSGRVGSLWALGSDVLEYYERVKNGFRGVLTPWEALNEATYGFWPGDLCIFVARQGVGKTFALLMMARQAWIDGKRVLFIGTEMSRERLALRLYAIHIGLCYDDFRKGRLSSDGEKRLYEGVNSMLSAKGFDIYGSNSFKADMTGIEISADESDYDIIFIDGVYLVRNRGINRTEIVSNTADDLKVLAIRKGVPIVATHQFNREADPKKHGSIVAEHIGLSDALGWNADLLVGMWRTPDLEQSGQLGWAFMKLREGKGKDFFTHWDFNKMDFSQVGMGDESRGYSETDGGDNEDDSWI